MKRIIKLATLHFSLLFFLFLSSTIHAYADESSSNVTFMDNNTAFSGAVNESSRMSWFAFGFDTRSKASLVLQMDNTLDVDLYIFNYDLATGNLTPVDQTLTRGNGATEYYDSVLDAGVYFALVNDYQGSGNFVISCFTSNKDAQYEINDTSSNAYNLSLDEVITGVIDNPFDTDYYSVTIEQPCLVQVNFYNTNSYNCNWINTIGSTTGLEGLEGTQYIKAQPGTYYFAVIPGTNRAYSSDSEYNFSVTKVANLSGDADVSIVAIDSETKMVIESDHSGHKNYINGNLIDINYSYFNESGYGSDYNWCKIQIDHKESIRMNFEDNFCPVFYQSSTMPAKQIDGKPVLQVTFTTDGLSDATSYRNFYSINCWGRGEYSGDTWYQNYMWCTVFIDPDSGKLVDIPEINYFYNISDKMHSINYHALTNWDYYNPENCDEYNTFYHNTLRDIMKNDLDLIQEEALK